MDCSLKAQGNPRWQGCVNAVDRRVSNACWSIESRAGLDRVLQQFVARPEPQLLLDVLLVGLDRLGAEEQGIGDRANRASAADQAEDFQFPIGQTFKRRRPDPVS